MEFTHAVGDIVQARYRILHPLGTGGNSTTYAAADVQSQRQVALKALSLRHSGDWKQLELFEREAAILQQLSHPAIPKYLDYFHVDMAGDRAFYLVQELAAGQSLSQRVEQGWRTQEAEVRRIAAQVLDILIYLHSQTPPVIHRDIKPQNLIISADGTISLVDFGAVQDRDRGTQARGSTVVGTYGYMAPEQFRGQAVPATDLYGLGTTLLFLLTHRSPSELLQERLSIRFRDRIQVSDAFADWLEKLLEPDVEDRFASAQAALDALKQTVLIKKPTRPMPRFIWVGAGVAGVAAVGLAAFFRYSIMNTFGISPYLCSASPQQIKDYLNAWGNPNLQDYSLLDCLLSRLPIEADQPRIREVINLLVARGADVNARNEEGTTPLIRVAQRGDLEVAQFLVDNGADVNVKNNDGATPLIEAAKVGNLALAQFLIDKGADTSNSGSLVEAAAKGNLEMVKFLIANRGNVNTKAENGVLPLIAAIGSNNLELVQFLVANGADVNARSALIFDSSDMPDQSDGTDVQSRWVRTDRIQGHKYWKYGSWRRVSFGNGNVANFLIATPLVVAAGGGNLEIAQFLIAHGADVNARDVLIGSPLLWAARSDSLELAEFLMTKGADVNARNFNDETPLLWAVQVGNLKLIESLIAKGADVNAKTNSGFTPLLSSLIEDISVNNREVNLDLAELLVAKGADINARTNDGKTPLLLAITMTKSLGFFLDSTIKREIVQFLIDKGADVNARANDGKTPLIEAADFDFEIVQLLIDKGVDVNARANDGKTSLITAALVGNLNVSELLIAKGADVNARDADGTTPLIGAALSGDSDLAELLMIKGADVNVRTNRGTTLFSAADSGANPAMIPLLRKYGAEE